MIVSYYQQLQGLAVTRGISLARAFTLAGISDSTYYRMMARPDQSLRLQVAQKVADVLEQLPPAAAQSAD